MRDNIKTVAISVALCSVFSAGAASATTYYWLSGAHITPYTLPLRALTPATVTYLHHPGPMGPRGYQGLPGKNGTPGTNGAAVVLRTRLASTYNGAGGNALANVPLSNAMWTQGATEVDLLVNGSLTYSTTDGSGSCPSPSAPTVTFYFEVDGNVVGMAYGEYTGGQSETVAVPVTGSFVDTGTATPHTVTLKVSSDCPNNNAAEPITITDARFDVVDAL